MVDGLVLGAEFLNQIPTRENADRQRRGPEVASGERFQKRELRHAVDGVDLADGLLLVFSAGARKVGMDDLREARQIRAGLRASGWLRCIRS